MAMIRRERVLPVPGTVTVRVNQKVQAADVIAEAQIAPKHYFLDVPHGLGVSATEASRLITCQAGERVEAGDILAGPVGITRRAIRAPADGRVASIDDGRILLEARGELYQMRAGFPGVVVATDGLQVVTLETTGALIQGVWGNRKQDFGVMRVVGDSPVDALETNRLDTNLRGAVLVAGSCDHTAPLHQATELSVRGVIVGGLASDLIPVARRLPYPILVTEGFGRAAMNQTAFALFVNNVGREVAVDAGSPWPQPGQRPEAVIPMPAGRNVALPDEVIPVKAGVRVRVVRPPYAGEIGIVQKVMPHIVSYPSGVRARSVAVEIDGVGTANVPLENLEILG